MIEIVAFMKRGELPNFCINRLSKFFKSPKIKGKYRTIPPHHDKRPPQLSVEKLGHMFIFFYGIMASLMSPVAVAAYAAAGISQGDPYKTGVRAFLFP